jgi:hypothetical protein
MAAEISNKGSAARTTADVDYILLNLKQLSQTLNVSYDFVKDMRKAGFEMPFGGLTTISHAWEWLRKNGTFRETARTFRLLNQRGNSVRRQRQAADKFGSLR